MMTVVSSLALAGETKVICQDDFGIAANSTEDQTAAIQQYIDAVAATGGGRAMLDGGSYVIRGSIVVPTGVVLEGSWAAPHHGIIIMGTVFNAYGGRGSEEGPALIELQQSSGVKGITIVYPEQSLTDLQPYPWAIHGKGMHNTVEDVTLVNAWQGIAMGPENNELHVIRNVYGCVLRRGVMIDTCTDIGRIENVHFNPHYWTRSGAPGVPADAKPNTTIAVAIEMQKRLEAFIFKRTDWEYVLDTFVFGAKAGYLFTKDNMGACNGQFHGIGADMCQYGVVCEAVQAQGILISNGEFVCGQFIKGQPEDRVGVLTKKEFKGSLQLNNCAFWGFFRNAIRLEGDGYVSLNQATMQEHTFDGACIDILAGRAVISQTMFRIKNDLPHVRVGPDVKRVILTDNFADGGVRIDNQAGDKLVARDNE